MFHLLHPLFFPVRVRFPAALPISAAAVHPLVKACRHAPFKSFLVIVLHGISTQRNSPVDNNRLVAIISFI